MTPGKPDQMIPSDKLCEPVCPDHTGSDPHQRSADDRRAALEHSLLKQRLFERFGTPSIFLFSRAALTKPQPPSPGHDIDALQAQARLLAAHAITLHTGLAIDDIYAHPLVPRADILAGHRMRAFIAAPIRGAARDLRGVICAADMVTRRWSGSDIDAMQRIVAQFEALRLSQS